MRFLLPRAVLAALALGGVLVTSASPATSAPPTAAPATAAPATAAPATAAPATAASSSSPVLGLAANPDWCAATAYAALMAAERQADADLWLAAGFCANESGPLGLCLVDALDDRDDALALAQAQYAARLALCVELGPDRYAPDIDPTDFSPNVTHPLFPLVVGRTLVYEKLTAEGLERIEVTTLADTLDIDGVTCRAVRDVVTLDSEVIEDTIDWYAQKSDGSVWYFGEIAKNFEDGLLEDLEGSWRHGKDGAVAGVVMLATPVVGVVYRQEFLLGEAEDVAKIVSLGSTVTVPAGTYANCVETEDSTPIEPGIVERKFYAPGLGFVREVNPVTGEHLDLIQIIN